MMDMAAANAIELAIDAKIEKAAARRTRTTGKVTRIDSDGTVFVKLDGSEEETPASNTAAAVKPDEIVPVTVENGSMSIDGNYSSPATDDSAANKAQKVADSAVQAAGTAQEAASSALQSAAIAADAADYAQQSLQSVVQGATTVEKAVSVMQTALEAVVDYDPNTTTETFAGDGSTTAYALQAEATDVLSVTVGGEEAEYTSATVGSVTVITLSEAPASGAAISVTYEHATVQEWFWHDANGAHVLGDTSGYRNDIDSTGMDIVEVATERSAAHFGADGATIGKVYDAQASDNESHLEMDYHSMQLIDKEGDAYFHVSDLRTSDGYATISEMFEPSSSTKTFAMSTTLIRHDLSTISATVDDVSVGVASVSGSTITLSDYAPAGSSVVITYQTSDPNSKAYTLGIRNQSVQSVGFCSVAEGYNVVASGAYSHANGRNTHSEGTLSYSEGDGAFAKGHTSHAEGRNSIARGGTAHAEGIQTQANGSASHAQGFNTIAAKSFQTAIGSCNIEDTSATTTHPSGSTQFGTYALIIGNGTADNARSNALAVKWNGAIDSGIADAGAVTWVNVLKGQAALYVPKDLTNSTTSNYAVGAVALETAGGGAWTMANYNNEQLQFVYITPANRSAGTNTTTTPLRVLDTGGIILAGHSSEVGDVVESDISSNVSCAVSTYTNLGSIALTAGVWVITGGADFASGAAGARLVSISTNSSGAPSALELRKCTEYVSLNTTREVRITTQRIVSISANTTYYLKAWQNGVNDGLNAKGNICAVRIK